MLSEGLDVGLPKLWPCVTHALTPTWVAYDTDADPTIDSRLLDRLGWAPARIPSRTNSGRRDPTRDCAARFTTLNLWWWVYTPPAPACVANPSSSLGGYWGGLLGYECDPADPDAVPPAALADPIYWIAPYGWWGWGAGGWPLTGFPQRLLPVLVARLRVRFVLGRVGTGLVNYRWLGRPPSPDDIPDPDVPVSTVLPVGAGLERLCRYAWVVWQWGYRVLDVDVTGSWR